jgi:chorismate mutase
VKLELSTLIAGPCSAESREQVLETAKALQGLPLNYFRAGIWKPRTRPGAFEGVGNQGLEWLSEVRNTFGFPICTEVATAEHVELAHQYKLDMVWIGARSTVNPFTVQELAEALAGKGLKVMVKNPVNPDLKLWIGAIERLRNHQVDVIGAIHRGFSIYESSPYRNSPNWQIPIDLKQHFPDLALICDPSHIGGARKLIKPLAQQAIDLHFDGLMIETHIEPENALTDAAQQIAATTFAALLNGLQVRNREAIHEDQLLQLRQQLQLCDEQLIALLVQRMQVAKEIGSFKKEHNASILQPKRWEESLKKNVAYAEETGLSTNFASQFLKLLHEESIRIQLDILSSNEQQPDTF